MIFRSREKATIVFKEEDFKTFRAHLIKDDGLERAAFLFLGKGMAEGSKVFYVHKLMLPEDSDYRVQHSSEVEPKTEFVLKSFSEFLKSDVAAYMHAHSHPFSIHASFSGVDNSSFPGMVKSLKGYLQLLDSEIEPVVLRIVCGTIEDGFTAECVDSKGAQLATVNEIRVIGQGGIKRILGKSNVGFFKKWIPWGNGFDNDAVCSRNVDLDLNQFDRNIRWLGEMGQRAISEAHLAVCGVGGIGSIVVAQARGLGFRKITLIDHDRVEESNLNRLVGACKKDIGKFKVDIMKREIERYDSGIQVRAYPVNVQSEEAHRAIIDSDMVINALDDDAARMEVQILSARYLKPLLDLGAGIILNEDRKTVRSMGGQVIFYIPGGACLVCQGLAPSKIVSMDIRELQRSVGYVQGTDETPPSVVTINSIIAGIGMDLVTRYLTGFAATPAYIHYDSLKHVPMPFQFKRKKDCYICGDNGIEGKGDEIEKPMVCPATPEDILIDTDGLPAIIGGNNDASVA